VSGSFHVWRECGPRFRGERCKAREVPARIFAKASLEMFVTLPR
jgi:hypothetical protein